MPHTALKCSALDALVNKLGGWAIGLSSPRTSYTVHSVKIPLETEPDVVELEADLYRPILIKKQGAVTTPLGTILVQSPYGRRFPFTLNLARIWAAYGYNVLFVSSRGTFGSGGQFDPAHQEAADVLRVVLWMRKQQWYTGSFATLGMSYLGFVQWVLMNAEDPLEDYAAAIVTVAPHDFGEATWGTGSFWLGLLDWAENSAITESQSWMASAYSIVTAKPNGNVEAKRTVPLLDGVKKALGSDSSTYKWFLPWVSASAAEACGPDASDFWRPMQQGQALQRTDVPVLLVGGWQDIYVEDTVHQYQRLRERGCTVGLTMGPWTHMEALTASKEALDWLDKYLAGTKKGDIRQKPVKVHVTGLQEWKWFTTWPPATEPLELFLHPGSQLSEEKPPAAHEAHFTFDPRHPTPTIGGPLLFNGGYINDSELAKRSDVLNFTTLPLAEDVEIHGKPLLRLCHSSDNPHVDLFVRLCEVGGSGASRNVCQTYRRLDPSRLSSSEKPLEIKLNLSDCAHRFKRGNCIRLLVAGGNFPHYAYNLGSGENQATGTTLRPAKHIVHCGREGSKVILATLKA